jgi:hypothetical protein
VNRDSEIGDTNYMSREQGEVEKLKSRILIEYEKMKEIE